MAPPLPRTFKQEPTSLGYFSDRPFLYPLSLSWSLLCLGFSVSFALASFYRLHLLLKVHFKEMVNKSLLQSYKEIVTFLNKFLYIAAYRRRFLEKSLLIQINLPSCRHLPTCSFSFSLSFHSPPLFSCLPPPLLLSPLLYSSSSKIAYFIIDNRNRSG